MSDSSPSFDSDFLLLGQLKAGDDRAFDALMEKWQQPLANFIYRFLGTSTDVIDLTQEVFIKVYRYKDRFEPKAKFSTWLFSIAINTCKNHLRWQKRHVHEALEPETGPVGESQEDQLIQNEELAILKSCITQLPTHLREALLLFEYHDMSYGDIAAAVGCSVKAVETRIYRARKILKEKLRVLGVGRVE